MKFIRLNKTILLIIALIGLGSLSFINLSADPVPLLWLHNQDEGNYSYNTRNLVLENKLVTDEVNFFFVSPLWTTIQLPFVKTFGIHFESFRFPAALSPILLAIIVFFFIQKVTGNRLLGFVGGLLTISNFLVLVHSRFAMPETTNLLFLTLGFVAWYFTLERYPSFQCGWGLLTGVFWTAAFLTKGNGISLGLTLVTSLALLVITKRQLPSTKQVLKLTLPFIIFGLAFLGTRLTFALAYPQEFAVATVELTEKYRPLLRSQLLNPAFWQAQTKEFVLGGEGNTWQYVPFLTIGALLFVAVILKKLTRRQTVTTLEILTLSFLIGSLSWYWLIVYKPARYFLLTTPALILANILLTKVKPRLGLSLLTLTLILELFLGLRFIYTKYSFDDVAVGRVVKETVGKKFVAGGGLDAWGLNEDYHFLNTYFAGFAKDSLTNQFQRRGWPSYFLSETVNPPNITNTVVIPIKKSPSYNKFNSKNQTVSIFEVKRF